MVWTLLKGKHSRISFQIWHGEQRDFHRDEDLLTKEVDGFVHVVLIGRDALLCNVRESGTVSNPKLGCKVVERVQS